MDWMRETVKDIDDFVDYNGINTIRGWFEKIELTQQQLNFKIGCQIIPRIRYGYKGQD